MNQGTSQESEFATESRRLEKATEQLKELINTLEQRTELIRASHPSPIGPEKPQPQLMSPLGNFLHTQGSAVNDACTRLENLLSELRI